MEEATRRVKVAAPPQPGGYLVDRLIERRRVLAGGEQVDVLGRPVGHPVLADRPRTLQGEPFDAGYSDPGHFTLDRHLWPDLTTGL